MRFHIFYHNLHDSLAACLLPGTHVCNTAFFEQFYILKPVHDILIDETKISRFIDYSAERAVYKYAQSLLNEGTEIFCGFQEMLLPFFRLIRYQKQIKQILSVLNPVKILSVHQLRENIIHCEQHDFILQELFLVHQRHKKSSQYHLLPGFQRDHILGSFNGPAFHHGQKIAALQTLLLGGDMAVHAVLLAYQPDIGIFYKLVFISPGLFLPHDFLYKPCHRFEIPVQNHGNTKKSYQKCDCHTDIEHIPNMAQLIPEFVFSRQYSIPGILDFL